MSFRRIRCLVPFGVAGGEGRDSRGRRWKHELPRERGWRESSAGIDGATIINSQHASGGYVSS